MRDKDIHTCPFLFDSVPDPLRLKKCVIKLFPKVDKVWLVANKMLEKIDNVVFSNADIVFFHEDLHFSVMIWVLIM